MSRPSKGLTLAKHRPRLAFLQEPGSKIPGGVGGTQPTRCRRSRTTDRRLASTLRRTPTRPLPPDNRRSSCEHRRCDRGWGTSWQPECGVRASGVLATNGRSARRTSLVSHELPVARSRAYADSALAAYSPSKVTGRPVSAKHGGAGAHTPWAATRSRGRPPAPGT
jgi:hypothetical protein